MGCLGSQRKKEGPEYKDALEGCSIPAQDRKVPHKVLPFKISPQSLVPSWGLAFDTWALGNIPERMELGISTVECCFVFSYPQALEKRKPEVTAFSVSLKQASQQTPTPAF